MELISLGDVKKESRVALLHALGFDTDGHYVLKDGRPVVDRYVDEKVTLENMVILPGSTVVLVDNPLSIASYLEEIGDLD